MVVVSVTKHNRIDLLKVDVQDLGIVANQIRRAGIEEYPAVSFNQKR